MMIVIFVDETNKENKNKQATHSNSWQSELDFSVLVSKGSGSE